MPWELSVTLFTPDHSIDVTLNPTRLVAPFASTLYREPSRNSIVAPSTIAIPAIPSNRFHTTIPSTNASAAAARTTATFAGWLVERRTDHVSSSQESAARWSGEHEAPTVSCPST